MFHRSVAHSSVSTRRPRKFALNLVIAIGILGWILLAVVYTRQNRPPAHRAGTDGASQTSAMTHQPDVALAPRAAANQRNPRRFVAERRPVHEAAPVTGHESVPTDVLRVELADPIAAVSPLVFSESRAPAVTVLPRTRNGAVSEPESQPDNDNGGFSTIRMEPPILSKEPVTLHGAGATFPDPLYQKWFSEYHALYPQVTISYQSIGSGGGIKQLQSGNVDFGATDGPMTNEQLAHTPFRILNLPTVLGAVVLTYNLPGIRGPLRVSPGVLADIFLGKIRKWNDTQIALLNPGAPLPDRDIIVVHHSNSGSVTYVLSEYLAKVSQEWAGVAGVGTAVNWPVGLGSKGCEGVEGTIRQMEGSIGYVEFIYALANKLPVAEIQNASGEFIAPNFDSIQAAAALVDHATGFPISITNPPGKTAYPIASFTWLLVPREWSDAHKKEAFLIFTTWMIDHGESMANELGYVPLPPEISMMVKNRIRTLR